MRVARFLAGRGEAMHRIGVRAVAGVEIVEKRRCAVGIEAAQYGVGQQATAFRRLLSLMRRLALLVGKRARVVRVVPGVQSDGGVAHQRTVPRGLQCSRRGEGGPVPHEFGKALIDIAAPADGAAILASLVKAEGVAIAKPPPV